MGLKEDVASLEWRLRDAEEKLEKLNQHGHEHQWLGNDEMVLTKGLVLWGNDLVTLDGALQLRCVQAGDKVAWFKMNEDGDVYLNLPTGTESFVIRNGNINYKIYFRHDGTNAIITTLTGNMILRSNNGGDIHMGLDSDDEDLVVPGPGDVVVGRTAGSVANADIFSGTNPVSVTVFDSGTNLGPTIELVNNKDTDNAILGALSFVNDQNAGSGSGTSFVKTVAYVGALQEGGGNNSGASLVIFTKPDGDVLSKAVEIDGSGIVDISKTTAALLVPRLTTTQRNALTPTNGMIIYNTTDNQMQGYINSSWTAM